MSFLPDLQWGIECMSCCPNCKFDTRVDVYGFSDNHPGRIVVGKYKNEFIISRRYICSTCKDKRKILTDAVEAVAADAGVEVTVGRFSQMRLRQ